MIINNLISEGTKELKKKGIYNPSLDAEILLTPITKKERFYAIINSKEKINKINIKKYYNLIERRKNSEPIAYILNKKEFWGINFFVDKNVLIPRPDTEFILEDALNRFKNKKRLNILDIGTGSGCILLSFLKEFKSFRGIGIDKSIKAIKIANYNSNLLKINKRVKFINCDVDNYRVGKYDVIVSNPPYINKHKIKYLSEDIKKFEPIVALDGGVTGLDVITKVINKAQKLLKVNGILYLEIGQNQSKKVSEIFKEYNFKIIKKLNDYKKNIRCIIGTKLK